MRSITFLTIRLITVSLMFLPGVSAIAQVTHFERPPIDYNNAPVNDPVAQLAKRLASGETKLEYKPTLGYLHAVLEELNIPVESQTLVFSKTSLQLMRISPKHPRAIYFNDDIYVGYCDNGDVLEFAATDKQQGAIFYTISQKESATPKIVRDRGNCLACHASSRTQNVPGYLVRSVFPDASGQPRYGNGTYLTDHTSDFEKRWGGWYVTGTHGSMRHMGNTISKGSEMDFDRESGANATSLDGKFAPSHYLSAHSDIVALMVLEHQTQMHNAITQANFETRMALAQSQQMNKLLDRPADHVSESAQRRIKAVVDNVLDYLLMCDEFPLTDKVQGTSTYAESFAKQGPVDSAGRSLRQLNLTSRLFEYPCSYLIYSPAFEGLPDQVRQPILQRLQEILNATQPEQKYSHLDAATRQAIDQILIATHPEYAALTDG
ncbi:hypothetical protein SV7mr_32060 [Stieleria bergensis]|uniref:Cytochrome c domain-containing protein n=2 Tax=Stieleria bergensis TaxID=2528025 RepID=A0A517SX14_9BACT|nr:hypothetical protein SV7mr_32060 [Planctomycetes bacterium SV_7m_r]